jgi:hypothetical protein
MTRVYGLVTPGWGQEPDVGACGHDDEPAGSIKVLEFFDLMNDY